MPHSVPHMVQLRKFIVSEDTIFLLLQYAEGKKHLLRSNPVLSSLCCLLYYQLSFLALHLIPLSLVSHPFLCPCSRQMFDRDECVSQVIILNTRWQHASLAMPTPGPPYIPLTLGFVCRSCVWVRVYNEIQPYF